METTSLETMLAELYALDPSLKDRDAETRAIMTAFIEAQPQVSIDPLFLSNLRDELTRARLHPYHANHHSVRWWFLHLAPVGAIALIALTLIPNYMAQAPGTITTNMTPETAPQLYSVQPADEVGVGEDIMRTKSMTEDTMESTSLTELTNPISQSDTIMVLTQTPSTTVLVDTVTLTAPGFLLISDAGSRTIGMSTLLNTGTTPHVSITLTESLVVGNTYRATLVHDTNGNATLDPTDTPVFDPFTSDGQPIEDQILSVPFDVVPALE